MHVKCCQCSKQIHDKETVIRSGYGDFCSDECWRQMAEVIIGYHKETFSAQEEWIAQKQRKQLLDLFRARPRWGDDL